MNNYHIGCGYKIGKSWKNYDASPISLVDRIPLINKILKFNTRKFPNEIIYGNIIKKKLCENNTADNIFCSHMLEHVSFEEGKKVLKNIYEMLKSNGVFRLVVPSLDARIDKYQITKDGNLFMESLGCVNKNENSNLINKLRFLLGNSRHKWMYDEKSLYNEIKKVGFKQIRKCYFGDSGIDIFSEVEEIERFNESDGEYPALAFHCIK